MFKHIIDIVVIALLAIAGFTHLLRLINLIVKPELFEKYKFISETTPSKAQLAVYYLLTLAVCISAVLFKISNFH
jgi:hypothetical protein